MRTVSVLGLNYVFCLDLGNIADSELFLWHYRSIAVHFQFRVILALLAIKGSHRSHLVDFFVEFMFEFVFRQTVQSHVV